MITEALLLPFPSVPRFSAGETGKTSEWIQFQSSNSFKWIQFKSSNSFTCSLTSQNSGRLSCLSTQNGGFRGGVGDGDGVIIVDHGSRHEFVEMFKRKTGYKIVEPAHMELAEPSIGDAFESCVEQGARHIIVSPFFLFPGRHWHQDIPSLTTQAAKEHLGVSYIITAPLGLHELLVDVMNDRIKHCLSHVGGVADECAVCDGTGKFRIY